MKRPAFMFYPADWRKDAALQGCSYAARGLWHEMLCVMHECQPYGHLSVNGVPIDDRKAARITGGELAEYKRLLAELEQVGVLSRLTDGTIYSRRMVKDERVRSVRAQAGSLGGNPVLLNQKDKHAHNQPDNHRIATKDNRSSNLNPTPSFAVAVALSDSVKPEVDVTQPYPPQTNGTDTGHPGLETSQPEGQPRAPIRQQWRDPAWVAATARIVQVERRTGESDTDFADRVSAALDAKRRTDKAEGERRAR